MVREFCPAFNFSGLGSWSYYRQALENKHKGAKQRSTEKLNPNKALHLLRTYPFLSVGQPYNSMVQKRTFFPPELKKIEVDQFHTISYFFSFIIYYERLKFHRTFKIETVWWNKNGCICIINFFFLQKEKWVKQGPTTFFDIHFLKL